MQEHVKIIHVTLGMFVISEIKMIIIIIIIIIIIFIIIVDSAPAFPKVGSGLSSWGPRQLQVA